MPLNIDPQAIQKLLFGGPQSAMFGTPPQDSAQPPTASDSQPQRGQLANTMPDRPPAQPPAPEQPPTPQAAPTPQQPQNAPIPQAPQPYKHGTLAKIMLGIGEALGNPLATHIGERDRGRQQEADEYTRNLPETQAKANRAQAAAAAESDEKKAQAAKDRYLPTRSGGVFDVTTGGFAPGANPSEQPHTVETGAGIFQWNPQTSRYDIPVGPGKASSQKPDSPEQQFIDEFQQTHKGASVADAIKAYGAASQKPEHEPKQMMVGPDGTVLEMRPGMKMPTGSKTVAKYGEPTADEQRRADLARNLNENFDQLEGIVSRRPELFGPLAGRWTELKGKFGSDDPDIAALATLEHQIGMAQISAHGMRSAHGIEGASQSIINGLHSGPKAIMGAIKAARTSVQTFHDDVEEAKGPAAAQPPGTQSGKPGGRGPKAGAVEDGYRFKGGDPSDPKSWEKVKP